jgi:hypothetical protein
MERASFPREDARRHCRRTNRQRFGLYASMLDVFENLDGHCDLIGERVAQLVDEQGGALRPDRMAGDSSDPSQRPLDGSAQAQLERFRARLRDTLGKCRGNQALLGALRELSMLASS